MAYLKKQPYKIAYAKALYERQQQALQSIPSDISQYPIYYLPLAPFTISGLAQMENWMEHRFDLSIHTVDKEAIDYHTIRKINV